MDRSGRIAAIIKSLAHFFKRWRFPSPLFVPLPWALTSCLRANLKLWRGHQGCVCKALQWFSCYTLWPKVDQAVVFVRPSTLSTGWGGNPLSQLLRVTSSEKQPLTLLWLKGVQNLVLALSKQISTEKAARGGHLAEVLEYFWNELPWSGRFLKADLSSCHICPSVHRLLGGEVQCLTSGMCMSNVCYSGHILPFTAHRHALCFKQDGKAPTNHELIIVRKSQVKMACVKRTL